MNSADITACICTCNRYELLEKALRSLHRQTASRARIRIMVVDTTKRDQRLLESSRPSLRFHDCQHIIADSVGLSTARNIALQQCETPFIAYIDDDAQADPSWIDNILDVFSRLPDAGAVGGPVAPIWESSPPPWLPRSMYGYLSILEPGGPERDIADGEWLCGANLALRVADARAIHPFREDLGRRPGTLLSNEELDFCRRLAAAGRRVIYSPTARVNHFVPDARCTQDWVRQRVAWQEVSDLILNCELHRDTRQVIDDLAGFFSGGSCRASCEGPLFSNARDARTFENQCWEIRSRLGMLRHTERDLVDLLGAENHLLQP